MTISIVDQQNDPGKSNTCYRDFGELYCQNVDWLTTFIRKNIRNRHEAEDIAHDVFERLIKNKYASKTKQPITFEGNIRAFISTIARGIIIDSWRKKELERKYLEYLADLYHDDAASHHEFVEIIDAIFVLDQMLRSLEDNIRYAFLLSHLYGKTYAEIAQQLGVSERKVKVYMSKAMLHCMKMRSKLELDQYSP